MPTLASQHWETAVTSWHISQAWVLREGLGSRGQCSASAPWCQTSSSIVGVSEEPWTRNKRDWETNAAKGGVFPNLSFFMPTHILSVLACFEKVLPKWLQPSDGFSASEWGKTLYQQFRTCWKTNVKTRVAPACISASTSVMGLWGMVTSNLTLKWSHIKNLHNGSFRILGTVTCSMSLFQHKKWRRLFEPDFWL